MGHSHPRRQATIGAVGTSTEAWGSGGRRRRRDTPRAPVRARWALWSAAAALVALGVAGILSFGGGDGVRLPPAVVVQPAGARGPAADARSTDVTSTAPPAASGEGTAVPVTGVTVVTATPQVVVEPSETDAGSASSTTGAQDQAGNPSGQDHSTGQTVPGPTDGGTSAPRTGTGSTGDN